MKECVRAAQRAKNECRELKITNKRSISKRAVCDGKGVTLNKIINCAACAWLCYGWRVVHTYWTGRYSLKSEARSFYFLLFVQHPSFHSQ